MIVDCSGIILIKPQKNTGLPRTDIPTHMPLHFGVLNHVGKGVFVLDVSEDTDTVWVWTWHPCPYRTSLDLPEVVESLPLLHPEYPLCHWKSALLGLDWSWRRSSPAPGRNLLDANFATIVEHQFVLKFNQLFF